jgi:hypothetical protein
MSGKPLLLAEMLKMPKIFSKKGITRIWKLKMYFFISLGGTYCFVDFERRI